MQHGVRGLTGPPFIKSSHACRPELRSRADTHSDNFEGTPPQAAVLDQAVALCSQCSIPRGCWTRRSWFWALSSDGRQGSTTRTVGPPEQVSAHHAGRDPESSDERPTRGPPGQGVARTDAVRPGNRVRPHIADQRQRRAGTSRLCACCPKLVSSAGRRRRTPTATTSRGRHVLPQAWTKR